MHPGERRVGGRLVGVLRGERRGYVDRGGERGVMGGERVC